MILHLCTSAPLRLFLLSVSLCLYGSTAARAQAAGRRMVVLVVPGLRADDLTRPELPTLQRLVERGAIGWMNTRTARVPGQKGDPQEAAYLTLGAGARATAGPYARVMSPDVLARLKAENARLAYPVPIGALGDMLRAAGLKTIVVGEEDDTEPRRAAILLAMDSRGQVEVSRLDDLNRGAMEPLPDDTAPFGLTSNPYAYLAAVTQAHYQVWVYGDVARADRYAPHCTDAMAARHRANALQRMDSLLGPLDGLLRTRFIVLSPSPADSAELGDRLAPILMFGDGVEPGLLTSGSTHRPGLVTSTDFLPTVAAYFGLKPPLGSVGRPMTVAPLPQPPGLWTRLLPLLRLGPTTAAQRPTPERWAALHERWMTRARQQAALGGLPTLQFTLVLATILLGVQGFRHSGSGEPERLSARTPERRTPFFPLIILALPLAQLLLPPVSPAPVWAAGLLLGAVVGSVALFGAWKPGRARSVGAGLMAGLATVVFVDLLTGGWLLQNAWMSYSVMEGARYYGIGNEYGGAVFAAGLIAAHALMKRGVGKAKPLNTPTPEHPNTKPLLPTPYPLLVACLLALAIVVGLPTCGANVGGFLALLIGFGAAGLVWWRGRLRARDLLAVLLAAALLLGALLALDLARGGAEQTHIARAVGSGGSLINVIARKAALNAYLLLHSPWTPGLLASLVGLWLLWRAPNSSLRAAVRESAITRGTAVGLLVGALALLLLNDSGVVAASETLLLAWAAAQVEGNGDDKPE